MIATLLLVGCVESSGPAVPADTDTGASGETGGSGDSTVTPEPRPELTFPADAEDLDAAAEVVQLTLTAGSAFRTIDGESVLRYAYNGVSPGPVIRANVGDTVIVDFENALDDPSTVHWHGLAVPNAMDGVSWVQDPVPAGGVFSYTFTATDPGSFWYHPHVDVAHQVDLGLYGMVVVADPTEPVADYDVVLVFDALDEVEEGEGAADDHTPPDPRTVRWTVNGVESPGWTLAPGSRSRARLLNASNTSYLAISWPGARLIGGEQGLLAAPSLVEGLVLAPGDRAEVEVDAGAGAVDVTTALWSAAGGASYGDDRVLFSVEGGESAPAAPLDFVFSGAAPSLDPGTTELLYTFAGGAPDTDWLINGEAWPDVTVQHVALGAEVFIELRNLSATNHPFHLHGHRFEVLSIDDAAPEWARWEDTLDLGIRSVVRLRLPANNPGEWALHCHLLGHEQGGMMTQLNVE
ncbi:copper oxidase [Deltaproteobacteria bacterium]|nr:copper oxidase [Deltaproteobacteria bacterium]